LEQEQFTRQKLAGTTEAGGLILFRGVKGCTVLQTPRRTQQLPLQKVRRKSNLAQIGVDYTLPLFYALLAFLKRGRKSVGRISKISPQKCKDLA